MDAVLIVVGVALLLLMMLTLYRAITGPTIIDRILAANVIGTKTTVLIVLIGTLYGRVEMFVDIALTYALLNFITSVAASRFSQRHVQPTAGPADLSVEPEEDSRA
jgi:multicomponent Na+:H+ antiporter subunit F